MSLDPWYKLVSPRKEVREGRSFDPNEFAIALEQVVAGKAPEDYKDPEKFFSRTCFTRALKEHGGLVLRRLSGKTDNTSPVLTLVTQFGGGKTHTLTVLYHLARAGKKAKSFAGVDNLLRHAELADVPEARAAVFVGNAWDPGPGRETPWIDVARQLAGNDGVAALGPAAMTTPPGTETLARVFEAAGGPVLVLFDEVLNFLNRHRGMAESFHAFIQNLTVAMTGATRGAAVISLPRSQVEMTPWDLDWQAKITKVVRRVSKDLIVNDDAEISEVIRRRLFEDLGPEKTRRTVAKVYADWCFEHRAQLPPEWTAVDTAATESKAREFLMERFAACYPFHPATLSVFQRKWQSLPQYQQTRGTLAMFAQWVSLAFREGYQKARREPLVTLGSAPLDVPAFRSMVLGQIGESRLGAAIETDLAGEHSHAKALDADTKGPLRDIHRRVGTAILFESSGGQVDKVARLPELRFALGEPEVDTTSVDTAAIKLEQKAFFMSRVGSDGYKVHHKATIRKAVSDRRASLDEEAEVKPAVRDVVKQIFTRGASVQVEPFRDDPAAIPDSPRLTLVMADPETEWSGGKAMVGRVLEWTRKRGGSDRLYPAALVWCFKKPGRELRDKVETWLAWKRVAKDVADGTLGSDYEKADRVEIDAMVKDAREAAEQEVWASYRYLAFADAREEGGLKIMDLGAGHSSTGETMCGRAIAAMKSQGLLNETVGAGWLERNWPPALKESGAWPLSGLRKSFLDGSLTRLLDPDATLKGKILEFVSRGDFGMVSGPKPDGTYSRVWFEELAPPEEVTFDAGVFLVTKAKAKALKGGTAVLERAKSTSERQPEGGVGIIVTPVTGPLAAVTAPSPGGSTKRTLRLVGTVPPELWNRLGTKVIPRLKAGGELRVDVEFSVTCASDAAGGIRNDISQALEDLGLTGQVRIEERNSTSDPT